MSTERRPVKERCQVFVQKNLTSAREIGVLVHIAESIRPRIVVRGGGKWTSTPRPGQLDVLLSTARARTNRGIENVPSVCAFTTTKKRLPSAALGARRERNRAVASS
jgi:hypothetical protein